VFVNSVQNSVHKSIRKSVRNSIHISNCTPPQQLYTTTPVYNNTTTYHQPVPLPKKGQWPRQRRETAAALAVLTSNPVQGRMHQLPQMVIHLQFVARLVKGEQHVTGAQCRRAHGAGGVFGAKGRGQMFHRKQPQQGGKRATCTPHGVPRFHVVLAAPVAQRVAPHVRGQCHQSVEVSKPFFSRNARTVEPNLVHCRSSVEKRATLVVPVHVVQGQFARGVVVGTDKGPQDAALVKGRQGAALGKVKRRGGLGGGTDLQRGSPGGADGAKGGRHTGATGGRGGEGGGGGGGGGGNDFVLEIERSGALAEGQCCSRPTTIATIVKNGGRFGIQVGHKTPHADQGKETHEKHGAGGAASATGGLGPESKAHRAKMTGKIRVRIFPL
jgi:hypothetical protein